MKACFMSDPHGKLPKIEKCDILGICGDIFPLQIQNKSFPSAIWFEREFVPWALNVPCEKVILIAGNHDFLFQGLQKLAFKNLQSEELYEECAQDTIKNQLLLNKKIVYLQDGSYTFNHKKFYGTPWIPDLSSWAYYKPSKGLIEKFKKIPEDCDVLLTHAAGTENNIGVSLDFENKPNYGCKELTKEVLAKKIPYWFCGHIHSGNHEVTTLSNGVTKAANVSILNEDYQMAYEPLYIEL